MPSPIELTFGAGESLGSLDSLTIGIGVVRGTVSMPFTPIEFSRERIARTFGQRFADEQVPVNNERFYWERYIKLPVSIQDDFYGQKQSVDRSVRGFSFGLNENGVLSAGAQGIATGGRTLGRMLGWGLGRVFSAGRSTGRIMLARAMGAAVQNFLSRVGLDRLQSSQTLNATLYGMNGNDTYNLNVSSFAGNPRLNICIIGGAVSAIAQAGGSVAFIGPFRSTRSIRLSPIEFLEDLSGYLYDVYTHSYAYVFLRDAAVGLILPGAQVQLVAS